MMRRPQATSAPDSGGGDDTGRKASPLFRSAASSTFSSPPDAVWWLAGARVTGRETSPRCGRKGSRARAPAAASTSQTTGERGDRSRRTRVGIMGTLLFLPHWTGHGQKSSRLPREFGRRRGRLPRSGRHSRWAIAVAITRRVVCPPRRVVGNRRFGYPAPALVGEPRSPASKQGAIMEPRITLITLALADLPRAVAFYRDGLGWPTTYEPGGPVAFFDTSGTRLALYPFRDVAADISPGLGPAHEGAPSITLAHNVRTRAEVAEVLALVERAGGRIVRSGHDTAWGGHIGYFRDPDGHYWEVAWNPGLPLDPDGFMTLAP